MSSRYDDLDRPPLDERVLRRSLVTPDSLWTDLEVVPETASTNADLAARAARDGRSGLVLIAEHQTAGRGRLARTWEAPARSGIMMSTLIRPRGVPVTRWSWLPLLTGLAVAAAIRSQSEVDARLKWPNDVMAADKKLAGILVERVETAPYPAAAIIGVGLNVSLRSADLPVPTATSLLLEGATSTDRSLITRAILRRLDGLIVRWQSGTDDDLTQLRRAYVQACSTIGQQVRIDLPGDTRLEGEAVGVDPSGRLLVETSTGRVVVGAGDVVHVRPLA